MIPIRLSARDLARQLQAGALGAREVAEAFIGAIDAANDAYNAYITVAPDVLAAATAADRMSPAERALRPLHGVPVAIKDVIETRGLRTTFGSKRYENHVPAADAPVVAALRAAGAVVLGKTNTPEFGFGAICDNLLYGPTRNPWDRERTSGGSSGGSAVAVATGLAPLALGTDFGGSVRTPASFCGCVGLRPTPEILGARPAGEDGTPLQTPGTLARSVDDAAYLAEILGAKTAGDIDIAGLRVACSADLGGAAPVDPEVRACFADAVERARAVFRRLAPGAPDCSGGAEAFHVLRGARNWQTFGEHLRHGTHDLTESFVWNVRQGEAVTAAQLATAEAQRLALVRRFETFFETADVLMLPSAAVLPFANSQREVLRIDGQPTRTIIDYLRHTSIFSLAGFPAISLPAGLTPSGLPFGVQLVVPPWREALLLAAARALEAEAGFCHIWPPAPNGEAKP
jgi:amidase